MRLYRRTRRSALVLDCTFFFLTTLHWIAGLVVGGSYCICICGVVWPKGVTAGELVYIHGNIVSRHEGRVLFL